MFKLGFIVGLSLQMMVFTCENYSVTNTMTTKEALIMTEQACPGTMKEFLGDNEMTEYEEELLFNSMTNEM